MKALLLTALLALSFTATAEPITEPDFKAPLGPKTCWLMHGTLYCVSW